MPEAFDVLAALIRVDRSPSLAVAARSLAAAGVPVFPCVVEGKRPLTRRGFLDASSDPARVAAWWSRTPSANIGIPTGAASGVVVVDVDVHGPHDGRAAFQRATDAGLVDGAGICKSALIKTLSASLRSAALPKGELSKSIRPDVQKLPLRGSWQGGSPD